MALFKCGMCGCNIEYRPGETVVICRTCGAEQTPPQAGTDWRANLYEYAKVAMNSAATEADFNRAANQFAAIRDYADAAALEKACITKADTAHKYEILRQAKEKMRVQTLESYVAAQQLLQTIPGWQGADQLMVTCQNGIAQMKARGAASVYDKTPAPAAKKGHKVVGVIVMAVVLCIAVAVSLFAGYALNPVINYRNAVALMDEGNYEKAISEFEKLGDYQSSENNIQECKYLLASALIDEGKYDDAVAAFEALDGYKFSNDMINEAQYQKAMSLAGAGENAEAIAILENLGDYKDSRDKVVSLRSAYLSELNGDVKIGDYISFGYFEQDNNTENGQEPIEWLVLAKENGKALVISKYILEAKPYHSEAEDITWETSSLRSWLNQDFIQSAFSGEEAARIVATTVRASDSAEIDGGADTKDQVFLLSLDQAEKYFASSKERTCQPTEYAKSHGTTVNSTSNNCWWWLRTPGNKTRLTAFIDVVGGVYSGGYYQIYSFNGVRPAMWIDLG